MKSYPRYKDSGVPWLGSVPEHWKIEKLKFCARFVGGGTPSKDNDEFWGGDVPWVSPKDMKRPRIDDTEDKITVAALGSSACTLIAPGAVLIVVRSGILQHTIPVAMNDVAVALNQDMKALLPDERVQCAFLAYQIQGCQRELREFWVKQGATVESIEQQRMADSSFALPDLGEQQSITIYLDRETARIDALLAEKDSLIGLLREYRQSVISERLSGEMLPGSASGCDWAPHLPTGWLFKRLKHLGQVRSGIAKGKNTDGCEIVEMPYLRVANVQDGYLALDEISTIEVAVADAARYLLQPGDVLMNEGGDYDKVGRGAVWHGEVQPCLHQNHVFAVRPEDPDMAEWIAATTQALYAKLYFMNNAKQSTNLASISQSNVKELPVLLPPKQERDAILAEVRQQIAQVDALLTHAREEITLLKELRAATIADAVLGRIDLRG